MNMEKNYIKIKTLSPNFGMELIFILCTSISIICLSISPGGLVSVPNIISGKENISFWSLSAAVAAITAIVLPCVLKISSYFYKNFFRAQEIILLSIILLPSNSANNISKTYSNDLTLLTAYKNKKNNGCC